MAREPDEIVVDGRRAVREYDDDGNVKRIRVLPRAEAASGGARFEPPPIPEPRAEVKLAPKPAEPPPRETRGVTGESLADRMRALRESAKIDRARRALAKQSDAERAPKPDSPKRTFVPIVFERKPEPTRAPPPAAAPPPPPPPPPPPQPPAKPRGFEILSRETVAPPPALAPPPPPKHAAKVAAPAPEPPRPVEVVRAAPPPPPPPPPP
ncbi:MAG: hypothetical protein ACYDCK_13825, partial [Thermoplasmatota archaeon]